jgi:glucokinase
MDDVYLALDFGGTKLSAALFKIVNLTPGRQDARAQEEDNLASSRPGVLALSSFRRVFTPDDADAAYELAAMLATARELLDGRTPAAVGVSFGGPVDFASGVVRLSHHVHGWEGLPLRDVLEREFGAPTAVDNDANVAALGEHRYGAGRDVDDLMYITISTGVGGGWVLGGRPWRGHEGLAGEIGHTVVDPAGPPCLCGKRGCVERLASGPYMASDYAARVGDAQGSRGAGEQGEEDDGRQTIDHGSTAIRRPLTGRVVADRAAAGDGIAREILLRGAWALGVGIGNAANLINPQRFILGGGVTKAGAAWWAEVRQSAAATALPEVRCDIVPAELGDDAPLWGGFVLAEESAQGNY